MNDKRYVYYNETGTNTHHYFATYEEAKGFIVRNHIVGGRIAYLLAYSKSTFVELEGGDKFMSDTFRKEYTPLDEEQKTQMLAVKDKAQELWDLIESFVPQAERSERARLVNIGRTDLEHAIAMIVKGITSAKTS